MSVTGRRVTVSAGWRGVTRRRVVEGNVGVTVSVSACSVQVETTGVVAAMLGVATMTACRTEHGHENQTYATDDEE